ISLLRIIKFSLQDITRNVWLSVVTISILILALVSVNVLLVVNLISDTTMNAIKEKIDVNLYLKSDAAENDIMALKVKISDLPNVSSVAYISKDEALVKFRLKYKDNTDILQALKELGKNPLSPSLVIKPKDASDYKGLITRLTSLDDNIVEYKNFDDHGVILDKINLISRRVNKVLLSVSAVFVMITILMVYNSIRMAIYTHRFEIEIMRLVGASRWFIRAPYLFSSLIYAWIGVVVVIAAFFPFLSILHPYMQTFFVGYDVNVFTYFTENFVQFFGLQFLGAVVVSFLASLIAVAKYSKV
ncbi:MAG: permease-like cell division protein FtsX, partial [Candidatus Falkowbacteria bacterium]|nr:permease-like cell division protein FtsX [Candidatus Falkowbacteria bacterium]